MQKLASSLVFLEFLQLCATIDCDEFSVTIRTLWVFPFELESVFQPRLGKPKDHLGAMKL